MVYKVITRLENVILFRPVFFFIHQGDFRNSINVGLELDVMFGWRDSKLN